MALNTKKDASFEYKGPEKGMHEARIVAVIYLGTHERTFEGKSKGMARFVYVVFEVMDEQDEDGLNKIIARDYPLFSGERANINKLCNAALGAEPESGYDLDKLPGLAVGLEVKVSDKGYANAGEITALRAQQKAKIGKPDNIPFYWDGQDGSEYRDHDWVPWMYSKAQEKRVKVSEMIAEGLANEADEDAPAPKAAAPAKAAPAPQPGEVVA